MRNAIRKAIVDGPSSRPRRTASRSAVLIVLALVLSTGCGSRASRSDLAAPDPTLGEAERGVPSTPNVGLATPASRARPATPTTAPEADGAVTEVTDRSVIDVTTVAPDAPSIPAPEPSIVAADPAPASLPAAVPLPTTTVASLVEAVEPSEPSEPSGAAAPSDDLAAAFAAAVARADGLTYHAVFEGQATAADGSTTHARIEVWNRADATRRDVAVTLSGHRLTTQQYRTATGRLVCFEGLGPNAPVTCAPVPGASATDGAVIAGAVDSSAGLTMTAGSVDGVPATCFHGSAGSPARPEACFDRAGIPIVLADSSVRVVRTALDTTITDADVTPPAT